MNSPKDKRLEYHQIEFDVSFSFIFRNWETDWAPGTSGRRFRSDGTEILKANCGSNFLVFQNCVAKYLGVGCESGCGCECPNIHYLPLWYILIASLHNAQDHNEHDEHCMTACGLCAWRRSQCHCNALHALSRSYGVMCEWNNKE